MSACRAGAMLRKVNAKCVKSVCFNGNTKKINSAILNYAKKILYTCAKFCKVNVAL